jgi:hypothetical protein
MMIDRRVIALRAVVLTVLALLLVGTGVSLAKVAPASLGRVVSWSEVIAVGTVISVGASNSEPSTASIRVEDVWKGNPGSEVEIDLTRTWPCDGSRAVMGERAVFFLSRADGSLRIAHAGLGRFPIREAGDHRYCDVPDQVITMPMDITRVGGPAVRGYDWSTYDLEALKRVVIRLDRQGGKK